MPRLKPPKAPDLAPRIVRLEQIAAALFGKVLSVDHDAAEIEIPADMGTSLLGMSGYGPVLIGSDQRYTPRRIITMQGQTVIDPAAQDLTTFYRYRVQLAGHPVRTEDKPNSAIAITRQVKP